MRSFPTVNISKRGGRRLIVLSNLRPSPDRARAKGRRLSHLRAEVSCSAIRQSGWMTVTYRPPSEERRAALLFAKAYPPAVAGRLKLDSIGVVIDIAKAKEDSDGKGFPV